MKYLLLIVLLAGCAKSSQPSTTEKLFGAWYKSCLDENAVSATCKFDFTNASISTTNSITLEVLAGTGVTTGKCTCNGSFSGTSTTGTFVTSACVATSGSSATCSSLSYNTTYTVTGSTLSLCTGAGCENWRDAQ